MKKSNISFLFLIYFSTINAQDFWEIRDSVNGSPKAACAGFVINGIGYVAGGLDDFGFKRKMYSYDPSQNDWDDELSIGGLNGDGLDRGSACSFSVKDKGYICLGQGQTNPYFKDTWEYDQISDTWTQKADFLGTARRQAVGFSIGDFAYVGTGQDVNGLCKDFYKFDPETNTWSSLADFPGTARRQAVAFTMGDEAYLGTGDDGVLKNDFWMYIPTTDTWIQKANFPGTPRAGATGWGIFPTGFIATGEDNNFTYTNDVWEYNYFSNTWTQRNNFPGPGRKNALSLVINGIAYLGTGYSGTFQDDFYAYTGIAGHENITQQVTKTFPNPFNNLCIIEGTRPFSNNIKLKLFDIYGRNVDDRFSVSYSNHAIKIENQNALTGQYLYIIEDDHSNTISSGKLILN
jgi:N-acetylneuraminic acid mutarotase